MSLRAAFRQSNLPLWTRLVCPGAASQTAPPLSAENLLLPILHRQNKIVWVFGKQFDLTIGADPVAVFNPHAHTFFGIIQARLDRNHDPGLEEIITIDR